MFQSFILGSDEDRVKRFSACFQPFQERASSPCYRVPMGRQRELRSHYSPKFERCPCCSRLVKMPSNVVVASLNASPFDKNTTRHFARCCLARDTCILARWGGRVRWTFWRASSGLALVEGVTSAPEVIKRNSTQDGRRAVQRFCRSLDEAVDDQCEGSDDEGCG